MERDSGCTGGTCLPAGLPLRGRGARAPARARPARAARDPHARPGGAANRAALRVRLRLRQRCSPCPRALVPRYPPGATIGWHRDAPAFGTVVGVSAGSSCRMRFRHGKDDQRRLVELEPRSAYVLAGPARLAWQHSIPPTKDERYSITFRTLKRPRG